MTLNQTGPSSSPARGLLWVRLLRLSGTVAAIESALVFVYAIALSIAALNSTGATAGNPVVEVAIFVIFAVLIALIAKSLLVRKVTARPAFILTQVFVLITAWTILAGDGIWLKLIGSVVGLLGVFGLGVVVASIIKQPVP